MMSAPKSKPVLIAGNSTSIEQPKAQAPAPPQPVAVAQPVAAPPVVAPPVATPVTPPPATPVVAETDGSSELWKVLQSASQAEKDHQPDAAINAYSKALKMKPDLFQTLMDRGRLYSTKRSYKEAIADFTAAIQVKPDSKDAYFKRCLVNLEAGSAKEAADDCSKTLQLDAKTPEPNYYRGLAYLSLRQFDKAAEDFTTALKKKNDDYPEAFFQLGKAYANIDRPLMALNAYTRAIQQRPGYTDAYKSRAEIRLALGDQLGASDDESRSKKQK
jgi:tetratricopeptide (TPR) repeat protein